MTRRAPARHAFGVTRRRAAWVAIPLVAALAALAAVAPAAASVTRALDLRELIAETDHIAIVHIVQQKTH